MPPSLNDYKEIEQTQTNACGAFALAAALHGLGYPVTTVHNIDRLDLASLTGYNQNTPITISLKTDFAELLYKGTGNLTLTPLTATYTYNHDPMNSPSGLVSMASSFSTEALDISVSIVAGSVAMVVFTAMTVTNLTSNPVLYNKDKALAESINCSKRGAGGVITKEKVSVDGTLHHYTPPAPGEFQLLLVSPAAGGGPNHWITIDQSDYYDPGTGTVAPHGYTLTNPHFNFGGTYTFSELWISLKKP